MLCFNLIHVSCCMFSDFLKKMAFLSLAFFVLVCAPVLVAGKDCIYVSF